jgi:hypothetical protein
MMRKYFTVFLLFITCHSYANHNTDTTDNSSSLPFSETKDGKPHLALPGTPALRFNPPAYRGGSGRSGVYFYWGVMLGYSAGFATADTVRTKGGGFSYGGDLGVSIELPMRNQNKAGLLTLSVGVLRTKMNKSDFGIITFPVSFTSLGLGPGGEGYGFFWQAGAKLHYLYDLGRGSEGKIGDFNRLSIEPFVSLGINGRFELRKHGETIAEGRVAFGPFFSYAIMNMSNVNGVDMHGYIIGIKYSYIFM